MHHPSIFRTAVAIAAVACFTAGAEAQEVSVFSVASTSTQPTLEESGGFGLSGVISASRWLRVEGSFTTVGSDSRRAARVCGSYVPPGNCGDEELTEEFTLRSYRLAYAPLLYAGGAMELAVKAGLSISQIVSDSRTQSTRKTNLQHSRTGQDGRFVGVQLAVRPLRRVPVAIQVGGVSHWVSFSSCQEYAFQYAPFCGVDRFDQLQVGLTYMLRR